MRRDYEKLFTHLKPQEPPAGLLGKIMACINEEERLMSIKKRLFLFSTTVLVSAVAFIPASNAFQADFAQSGFPQLFSLAFSDLGSVITSWQDFGLALLESLPAMTLISLLITTLVFLWSLKHLIQAMEIVFNQPQLINS